MSVAASQLTQLCPTANPSLIEAIVNGWPTAEDNGITTPLRIRHFFARVAVETGGLRAVEENLSYNIARLRKVWPKRFPTDTSAVPYARNPKKLAIKVYGGRLGNAPDPSTDGWDYRGGGMMQTTGRANYKKLGFEDNPEALRDPDTAFETAVREWKARGCNELADADDVVGICKAINGGTNGLVEQKRYLAKAVTIWTDDVDDDLIPLPGAGLEEEPPVPLPPISRPPSYDLRAVQVRLKELGYTEVGNPNGEMGDLTKTAILAFRSEHGLPLMNTIDEQFLTALWDAKPRVLAPARTEATAEEVRQQVPEVKANWLSRAWAWFMGGGAGLVGVATAGGEADPNKQGILKQMLGILQDIPPYLWCAIIVAVAVAIIVASHRGVKEGEQAYREGARR